jgi:xeroderma pigmentosum group C-complementing protein
MSFEFNLSSDEEDLEEWTKKEGFHEDHQTVGGKFDDDDKVEEKKDSSSFLPFASLTGGNPNEDSDDGSDEGDEIDWEDAEDEHDGKMKALKPVMIDLGVRRKERKEPAKAPPKKRKRKNTYRLQSLPENVQSFLKNLHRSHLLALTSNAVHRSNLVNTSSMDAATVLAAAHSLLPRQWALSDDYLSGVAHATAADSVVGPQPPTLPVLREFFTWYRDLIHNVEERRQRQQQANQAAGAPTRPRRGRTTHGRSRRHPFNQDQELSQQLSQQQEQQQPDSLAVSGSSSSSLSSPYSSSEVSVSSQQVQDLLAYTSYLSPTYDENPQLVSAKNVQQQNRDLARHTNQVLLLVAMTRSLGWRTRYVQAMQPSQQDLDVDHPLLTSSTLSLFQSLLVNKGPAGPKRKKRESPPATSTESSGATVSNPWIGADQDGVVGWVEILCQAPGAKKRKLRWIHVDPVNQLFDQPDQVEFLLPTNSSGTPNDDKSPSKGKSSRRSPKNNTKRTPLAYAIAVEHGVSHSSDEATAPRVRLTDVTPRYADSWIASLRLRGVVRGKKHHQSDSQTYDNLKDTWWIESLETINNVHRSSATKKAPQALVALGSSQDDAIALDGLSQDDGIVLDGLSQNDAIVLDDYDKDGDNDKKKPAVQTATPVDEADDHETEELNESASSEAIPTRKTAFNTHPLYVIASVLNSTEVLALDASKRMCGVFKGELVYRRSDVSTLRAAKKWLYQGHKVLEHEMTKPIKRAKVRKKASSGGFEALQSYGVGTANDGTEERRAHEIEKATQPLEDGMENLYAFWQTEPWAPSYVGPGDTIPVNEYKNIELELMNPGLVHIDQQGVAKVAKKLGIPYAPCLLGFEGHHGNRTPTIRGIVVHRHNEQLLQEANVEVTSHAIEEEHKDRRKAMHRRWKKLLAGLLLKDRLDREYS